MLNLADYSEEEVPDKRLLNKLETVSIAEPLQNRQHAQNP